MDRDILMALVGGFIGLVSSLCIMALQRHLDKCGKLNIFYLFSYQKGRDISWGFERMGDNSIVLTIPVVYEIQNTSNVTRVIRDVSLLLYNNDNLVTKMFQASHIHARQRSGEEVVKENDAYFGADKGSYSFVIPPRSIIRQECEYIYI